eukprot:766514-Hanusia_phi.AAC.4
MEQYAFLSGRGTSPLALLFSPAAILFILAAVFTVSPNSLNLGVSLPAIPAKQQPLCIPILSLTSLPEDHDIPLTHRWRDRARRDST